MERSELTQDLKSLLRREGARLVGVANAERLAGAPRGHRPADILEGARSVVSIGLPIMRAFATGYGTWLSDSEKVPETVTVASQAPNEILSGLRRTTETYWPRTAINNHIWRRCAYEFMNLELQRLSFRAAMHLEDAGFPSLYMPTTYGSTFSWQIGYPIPAHMAPFSHRHAAVAAGLGIFGLSNNVLVPRYGPMVRFVSVISAAPLAPDPLCKDDLCHGDDCRICRDECPNECLGNDVAEYDFGGVHVRGLAMDKDRCGRYQEPGRLPCTRQCATKCPADTRA